MLVTVDIGQRIGHNLALYLKRHKITASQLAARAGLSQPTVSQLASQATKDPPITTLLKIVAVTPDLSLDDLLKDVSPSDVAETAALEDRTTRRVDALEKAVETLPEMTTLLEELRGQVSLLLERQDKRRAGQPQDDSGR